MLKRLLLFQRSQPSSRRLKCLGRTSIKRNFLDVYVHLLIRRLSGHKSVLDLLLLPIFCNNSKDLELNCLHSVQAVNVFKHCWMLKHKITALFNNKVFHKIGTVHFTKLLLIVIIAIVNVFSLI